MSIYPINEQELDAAAAALDNAINGGASLGSCVHAVLGAIEKERADNRLRHAMELADADELHPHPDDSRKLSDIGRDPGSAGAFVPPLWLRRAVKKSRRR
jgi:hypothetical protein